jgi:16S rRNA U1498 N3-methylase RsmE
MRYRLLDKIIIIQNKQAIKTTIVDINEEQIICKINEVIPDFPLAQLKLPITCLIPLLKVKNFS